MSRQTVIVLDTAISRVYNTLGIEGLNSLASRANRVLISENLIRELDPGRGGSPEQVARFQAIHDINDNGQIDAPKHR